MNKFSHKQILLYGHVSRPCGERIGLLSYKSVFYLIGRFREEFRPVRDTIDAYVDLVLRSAGSGWRQLALAEGQICCDDFLHHNKSILDLSYPDRYGKAVVLEEGDILPDLLVLSSADQYFKAWKSYVSGLDRIKSVYLDFQAADKYRTELVEAAGETAVNALFVQMWRVFYGRSLLQVFHEGFSNALLDSALSVERETDRSVWQLLTENLNR